MSKTVEVRVRQLHKTKWITNKISGHCWPEHTPIERWEVVGPFGVCGTYNKKEYADKQAVEWTAFYNKFFPRPNENTGT